MSNLFVQLIADWMVFAIVAIAGVALLIGVPHKHKIAIYSRILIAGLAAYWLAKVMAAVYQPSQLRPFELMGVQAGASYLNNPGFPSDHSLFVWAIVYAVWYARPSRWLVGLLIVLALMVSVGRVVALVHTPLDVIGGAIAASLGASVYLLGRPKNLQEAKK